MLSDIVPEKGFPHYQLPDRTGNPTEAHPSAVDTVVILTTTGNNIYVSSPNPPSRRAHWFANRRDTKGCLNE
jgi:hypothetical protein